MRGDLRRLHLFLSSAEQLASSTSASSSAFSNATNTSNVNGVGGNRRAIANVVAGRVVHVFLVQDDLAVQYFVPAVAE